MNIIKLVAAGAKVNVSRILSDKSCSQTSLYLAAQNGYSDIVKILLSARAEVNIRDDHNTIPLHCAAFSGNIHTVQLLLAASADKTVKTTLNNIAHTIALSRGHDDIAELLK